MIQIHHDVALEPHYFSASGNSELVGRESSVQQFDVDMLIRRHRALAHVDKCPRQARLVATGGLQKDSLLKSNNCSLVSNNPLRASSVTVVRSSIKNFARSVLRSR